MTTLEAPAGTRKTAIVHATLKPDLLRVRDVLTAPTPACGRQRQALGHRAARQQGLGPARPGARA